MRRRDIIPTPGPNDVVLGSDVIQQSRASRNVVIPCKVGDNSVYLKVCSHCGQILGLWEFSYEKKAGKHKPQCFNCSSSIARQASRRRV